MTEHPTATGSPDPRAIRLRSFLTDEARQSLRAAPSHTAERSGPTPNAGRRLVVCFGVVAVLGAALFGVNALVGGPGPMSVPQAVAIESSQGWTTVRLLDEDADPTAVLAQLTDAGIPARISRVDLDRPTVHEVDGGTMALGGPGDRQLLGLSVWTPDLWQLLGTDEDTSSVVIYSSMVVSFHPDAAIPDLPGTDPEIVSAIERARREMAEALDHEGVRIERDGSVSFRTGSDAQVVVLAAG